MKHNIIDHGEVKILELSGKITIGEGDIQLRKLIDDVLGGGTRKIVMDLKDLKYIDSSGIGELVSCYSTIKKNDGVLRLANLHSKIYSLLQLTALVTVFEIYDSVEDALQSLS